jgi:hypothetical protein
VVENATIHFVDGESSQGSLRMLKASLGLIGGNSTQEVTTDDGPLDINSISDFFGTYPATTQVKIEAADCELAKLGEASSLQPHLWIEVVPARAGGAKV